MERQMLQVASMNATEFVTANGDRYEVTLKEHPVYGMEAHCKNVKDDYTVIYTYEDFQTKGWNQVPKEN